MSFDTRSKITLKFSYNGRDFSSLSELKFEIEKVLTDALREAKEDTELWVDDYVPADTLDLRNDIKKNIKLSRRRELSPTIIIKTDIPYIKYVNKMETDQVRHFGEEGGRSGYLYDPKAIGHFWGFLRMDSKRAIRKRAREHIRAANHRGLRVWI